MGECAGSRQSTSRRTSRGTARTSVAEPSPIAAPAATSVG